MTCVYDTPFDMSDVIELLRDFELMAEDEERIFDTDIFTNLPKLYAIEYYAGAVTSALRMLGKSWDGEAFIDDLNTMRIEQALESINTNDLDELTEDELEELAEELDEEYNTYQIIDKLREYID